MGNIHSGETTTLTIRIPVEMKEQLSALGKSTRRSNSFLAAEAVAAFIESEREFAESIKQARKDIAQGKGIPQDTVMKDVREMIKSHDVQKRKK